ncbi:hypothetical protein C9374_005741 [Naegleria lovaniensis]|uniref:Mitochondrial ATPase complex subunit ATP10 n=1 Tax=Naegleria lovaniensis TaxID=51637 RepID=A0AA88KHM6_NAELO|nr:uncharacterized protein C9374_005741 [Naegleria lovaniensis]KAG2381949.1 hypothetical protein C9374_005741 [Naegleria lovaniensis]
MLHKLTRTLIHQQQLSTTQTLASLILKSNIYPSFLKLDYTQHRFFLKKLFGKETNNSTSPNDNDKQSEFLKEREKLATHLKNEREQIYDEINRYSPLKEIKSVLKHKGKLFISTSGQLTAPEKSIVFPSPDASLGDGRNKVAIRNLKGEQVDLLKMIRNCRATLLFVNFTEYGSNMTKEWKEAFDEFQKRYTEQSGASSILKAQCIDFSISENYVIAWLESVVMNNLKSKIAPEMHDKTLVTFLKSNNETYKFKDMIQITNSKTCYVFVIDQQCRIRWKAVGLPEGKEKEFMISAIQQLVAQTERIK